MKKLFLFFISISYSLFSQEYKIPPEVIRTLVESDPQPSLNLNDNNELEDPWKKLSNHKLVKWHNLNQMQLKKKRLKKYI